MGKYPKLGFGIMRMPQKDGKIDWEKSQCLIDEYMKGDYCYFDTHPSYMMNQSQRIIKKFVVDRYERDRFLIANKMPYFGINDYEDYTTIFNQELLECGVEYFDNYLLHAVSKDIFDMHVKYGGFSFLEKIKKCGRVKKIGISFHDKSDVLEDILKKFPVIDFVQLQINYMDWESPVIQSKACYEVARKFGKSIIVMEPIKGGSLARGGDAQTKARRSLQFVKTLPGIEVILSGMSEIEHIMENRATLESDSFVENDSSIYQKMKREIEKENVIPCTQCGYCIRECQKKIKIPEIFGIMNMYYRPGRYDQTIYGRMKMLYQNTVQKESAASACINCGMCEKRCPQKIPIRENLRKAAGMFEKKHFYIAERNAQILIYLLREYKIKKIIASPGATNASFVYSLQQDDYFEVFSAPDERSAAYMACGLAEESGEIVALSCTGATASRNYIPGLTEAYYRNIPVLAITSSQPNSRIGHNIPQMTDRTKMQNDIVKISVEMPIVKDMEDEWFCVVNANKALNELWHKGMGPVHINLISAWSQDFTVRKLPYTRVIRRIQKDDTLPRIPKGKIGIFCGTHSAWSKKLELSVDSFCKKYGAVVICDHTSNYTGRFRYTPSFIDKQGKIGSLCVMDLLIHIGNVSGAYFPMQAKEVWRIHPDGRYCDTFRTLSYVFEMEEYSFFQLYAECFSENNIEKNRISEWPVLKENLHAGSLELPFSNVWIASQTACRLPENSVLHLGILNSLRVWNFYRISESVRVYSNTGGFGIDGCVSTLIGASLANPDKIYFAVLGDLAFFYDMNSLGNRHIGKNIRLLVINNGCGTEFKNYNHVASVFGEQTDLYIAAKGHYGNKSDSLLKNYAENLGFLYRAAGTKEEYNNILSEIVNPKKMEKSIVVEVFTDSEAESEALSILNSIKKDTELVKERKETLPPEWIRTIRDKEVVLWGCGNCFLKNLAKVEQYVKVRVVCDNDRKKWDTSILPGICCISPKELEKMENIFVVIMLEDAKIGFNVSRQLQTMGIYYSDIVENWLTYAHKIEWSNIDG